jgi:tetratricopeptide (TPR) repeat protein
VPATGAPLAPEARAELLVRARHAHQHHDADTAQAHCRTLLAADPADRQALLLLGLALVQAGRADEGTAALKEALAGLGPGEDGSEKNGPEPSSGPDTGGPETGGPDTGGPDTRGPDAGGPATSDWFADLGLARLFLGRTDEALAALERALALPAPSAAAYTRAGALLLARGDMERAEAAFVAAAERDPGRAELHANLGAIRTRQRRYEEALNHFNRAAFLNPDLPQAASGRAALLVALERANEIIFELEARIDATCHEPESDGCVTARIALARVLDGAGRWDDAVAVLRQGLAAASDCLDLLRALAQFLFQRQRFVPALAMARRGLDREPEDLALLLLAAEACSELALGERAQDFTDKALEVAPEAPGCRLAHAQALLAQDRNAEAEAELRDLTETLPGLFEGWSRLGGLLLQKGDLDGAVAALEKAAELNPAALAALVDARRIPDGPDGAADAEALERLADNPLAHRDVRSSMNFALARLLETRGDHDAAFARARAANDLALPSIDYDMDAEERRAERIMEVFTPGLFARYLRAGSPSQRPVFVVGMPRSGTTLTEQILCSHTKVFGAGELGYIPAITRLMPRVIGTRTPYPDCMELFDARLANHAASYYLRKTAALDDAALRVVDKLPHNFLHLGLIRCIFPRARVVALRRDPLDVAVSNYFTNFKQRHGLGYAFDLGLLARMLRLHERIMAHWRRVLPGPLLELRYEDLVERPEETSRALLDFVGLDWDPAVLQFHKTARPVKTASVWQVRRPLYSSSRGRWRRYAAHLSGLARELGLADAPDVADVPPPPPGPRQ